MSYVATVLAKQKDKWNAHEVDLDEAGDIDEVVDVVNAVDGAADTSLLFVEEEDEYVAIVRVDGEDGEPRVFLSDGLAPDSFPLAELLIEGIETAGEDEEAAEATPVGDLDLLSDLGTPEKALLRLCDQEGTLPSDVVAAVCENAGCLDQLEALRDA